MSEARGRVLLLIPTTSYKTADFMEAAERLGVQLVVGTDRRQALEKLQPGHTLALDLLRPDRALSTILDAHFAGAFAAVVGTDDETTLLAATAAEALGLPHNPPEAVAASRDKYEARQRFAQADMAGPEFELVSLDTDSLRPATGCSFPCVLKPRGLSGSRGVMRCDDPEQLAAAFARVRAIVEQAEDRGGDRTTLLLESYLPGTECTVEGLLEGGELCVLALLDKPDPMEGPTFEETLFVTPSRMAPGVVEAVERETRRACAALGLREGPVHAELRVANGQPVILEVAPRTIGGLCSRTLRFGAGMSLEEIVIRHAQGIDVRSALRQGRGEGRAAGVSMLPVLRAGRLDRVEGLEQAGELEGIREVTMTVHRGDRLEPLPEGHRYAGFIFADGDSPAAVEKTLRAATKLIELRYA
jgi:biotin carboxylase